MESTRNTYVDKPEIPQTPGRVTPRQDRRRAAWIILAVVASLLLISLVLSLLPRAEDPVLPEARTATGAYAPAMPLPAPRQ